MNKVYLAGPIRGWRVKDAENWRKEIERIVLILEFEGGSRIECLSPLRGLSHLTDPNEIIESTYENFPISTAKGIVTRDRFDVMRCDVVLAVLLDASEVSIGTIIELGWADAFRKPIILVIEKEGNPNDHPMIRELASYVVETIDEAVNLLEKIL